MESMNKGYLNKLIDFKITKVVCFKASIQLFFDNLALNKNAEIVIYNDYHYNKKCLSELLKKKLISVTENLEEISFKFFDDSNLTINLKHEAWINGPEALVLYIDNSTIVWN